MRLPLLRRKARHCEDCGAKPKQDEAISLQRGRDCFGPSGLAMTVGGFRQSKLPSVLMVYAVMQLSLMAPALARGQRCCCSTSEHPVACGMMACETPAALPQEVASNTPPTTIWLFTLTKPAPVVLALTTIPHLHGSPAPPLIAERYLLHCMLRV